MCRIDGARCENDLSWQQIHPWWLNKDLKVSISKIIIKNTNIIHNKKWTHKLKELDFF
jgi:hypothetical protein